MKMLYTKIINLVKRAYVSKSLPDNKEANVTQVSYFGKAGTSEVVSPYGVYVNLPKDLQVLLFAVQGQEDNRACIGYSQADRFKNLKEGEVLIGNPKTKTFIKFNENGSITIDSKSKIEITSAGELNINVTGAVKLTASGSVDIDSPQVNLGVGGQKIARLGDQVTVGANIGTITSAGTNTSI